MRFQFGFSKEDEQVLGTILTLGNGQLGVRGEFELERSPYGTIVSGSMITLPTSTGNW